jgi:hypothetical protein
MNNTHMDPLTTTNEILTNSGRASFRVRNYHVQLSVPTDTIPDSSLNHYFPGRSIDVHKTLRIAPICSTVRTTTTKEHPRLVISLVSWSHASPLRTGQYYNSEQPSHALSI